MEKVGPGTIINGDRNNPAYVSAHPVESKIMGGDTDATLKRAQTMKTNPTCGHSFFLIFNMSVCALLWSASSQADQITKEASSSVVRQHLRTKNLDALRAHMQSSLSSNAPKLPIGLRGEFLSLDEQPEKACALYLDEAGQETATQHAALLRAAQCTSRLGHTESAQALWMKVLTHTPWATIPLVGIQAWESLSDTPFKQTLLNQLIRLHVTDESKGVPTQERKTQAELFRILALNADEKNSTWAFAQLYHVLADTPAALELITNKNRLPSFLRVWLRERQPEDILNRARTLVRHHKNKMVFRELRAIRPKSANTSEQACEIRFLLGKTARKVRHYKTARRDLDFVAASCGEPWKQKALYLAARVASFQNTKETLLVLDAFLEKYPSSDYSDDVTVWKAEYYSRRKKYAEAEAVFETAYRSFPNGDMHFHAGFQHALLPAFRNKSPLARKRLQAVLNFYQTKSESSPNAYAFERDQLHYWLARLAVFPDIHTLKPNTDSTELEHGIRNFRELTVRRAAGYYGHLAWLNLQWLKAKHPAIPLSLPSEEDKQVARRSTLDTSGSIQIGAQLKKQTSFQIARQLVTAGFDKEAVLLLDRVRTKTLDPTERTVLSLLYHQANRPDRAHQIMRFMGNALPANAPYGDHLLDWTLAFPRAYEQPLSEAARQAGFSPRLLQGLSREESAFQADVKSWAGAIGLCQLMPPTAKEEAERIRMDIPATFYDDLLEPELNATLGANHLQRRMRSLKHPLLGIAAYNAGPGNVNRWRKQKRLIPVDAFVESIPVEQTRKYVKKVTGSWVVYSYLDGEAESQPTFSLTLPK